MRDGSLRDTQSRRPPFTEMIKSIHSTKRKRWGRTEVKISRAQWCALAAACGIGFASSANYTNHAPMVTALAAEFGFKLAAAGLLTTGVFLTHGGMQIPGGYFADRLGPKPVITIALAVVCLGNVALGMATGYWQLLSWKIFVGLGTGTCFVA